MSSRHYPDNAARRSLRADGQFTHGARRVDRERLAKLRQLRAEGRDPFQAAQLPSRTLAADIYGAHDRQRLEVGEHPAWRYVVAGRLVARRKHRHATFLDLQDESGVVELCVRRERRNDAQCAQLVGADLGDIVSAEGFVYVTDNQRLTLSVVSATLLVKALRSPPARGERPRPVEPRHRKLALDLLVDERARTLLKARSAVLQSCRAWMARNSFLEVEAPVGVAPVSAAAANPRPVYLAALARDGESPASNRLYLRRCLLGGLERVFELRKDLGCSAALRRHRRAFTLLEWIAAYTDYKQAADQAEEIILNMAEGLSPRMRLPDSEGRIDLSGPWRRTTLHQAIAQECGLDIFTAHPSTLAEYLKGRGEAGRGDIDPDSWGLLVTNLYRLHVEPTLMRPTIVYDFPMAGETLAKRHDSHQSLAERFEVVIAGVTVASGHSELNDPQEQWCRFASEQAGEAERTNAMAHLDEEVRLLEYGVCPAAGTSIELDRIIALLATAEPETPPAHARSTLRRRR